MDPRRTGNRRGHGDSGTANGDIVDIVDTVAFRNADTATVDAVAFVEGWVLHRAHGGLSREGRRQGREKGLVHREAVCSRGRKQNGLHVCALARWPHGPACELPRDGLAEVASRPIERVARLCNIRRGYHDPLSS